MPGGQFGSFWSGPDGNRTESFRRGRYIIWRKHLGQISQRVPGEQAVDSSAVPAEQCDACVAAFADRTRCKLRRPALIKKFLAREPRTIDVGCHNEGDDNSRICSQQKLMLQLDPSRILSFGGYFFSLDMDVSFSSVLWWTRRSSP